MMVSLLTVFISKQCTRPSSNLSTVDCKLESKLFNLSNTVSISDSLINAGVSSIQRM